MRYLLSGLVVLVGLFGFGFGVQAADQDITILYPNGGEVLSGGGRAPVVWSATYETGSTLTLYYRSSPSTDWRLIVRDIDPGEESITWSLPNISSTSAMVRGVLEAPNGSEVTDESNATFTIQRSESLERVTNIRDKIIVTYPQTITLEPGQQVDVEWDFSGDDAVEAELYYSVNNGKTFQLIADGVDPTAERVAWTVPSIPTEEGRIQGIIKDSAGRELARDWNNGFFSIGVLSSESFEGEEVTLTVNFGETNDVLIKSPCPADSTFRHPCRTVYYLGIDGNRHAFPNEKVYFSWYDNYDTVQIITEEDMQRIPLGKNVRYKAGIHLVKFQTFPTVFAVARNGVLRAIASEEVARGLYGENWNKNVHDISDVFFNNYTYGDDILFADQYNIIEERQGVQTINQNLGL